jgi:quercetin dioxygenase-like cupin family protein
LAETKEILIPQPDPDKWVHLEKTGCNIQVLWENEDTGASIALLDAPAGAGVPTRHSHASNQFMYCIEGEYEYTDSGLKLTAGAFYMNPKGHPHGPTKAHTRCLLLEIYDGPHYFELPDFHSADTVGRIAGETDD